MAWQVDPRVWDDERFCALSDGAQLTWLVLLTGPQREALPGLQRCGLAAISEVRRRSPEQVAAEIREIEGQQMVQVDPAVRVVRVPNAPRYAGAPNVNVLRAWFRQWRAVPDCALKYLHLGSLQRAVVDGRAGESVRTEWQDSFGEVIRRIEERGHTLESYAFGMMSTGGAPPMQLSLVGLRNGGGRRTA